MVVCWSTRTAFVSIGWGPVTEATLVTTLECPLPPNIPAICWRLPRVIGWWSFGVLFSEKSDLTPTHSAYAYLILSQPFCVWLPLNLIFIPHPCTWKDRAFANSQVLHSSIGADLALTGIKTTARFHYEDVGLLSEFMLASLPIHISTVKDRTENDIAITKALSYSKIDLYVYKWEVEHSLVFVWIHLKWAGVITAVGTYI